ncbi:hypothetical protein HYH03_006850 [Edaphochlamys debaryana]|uniref:FAS1 domain-containing protein n=1 Tax=Edaphochlamys debaryana TaxID=47281 RepID=A0A835Y9M3_9CHLO|nr:hypothetical protein HYH03_006850 [Edaphochlamys debaryana]|eukprot:KAG2494915.1 hypothetical protein HYH03_006850 [Edaphochlamys debaryana]
MARTLALALLVLAACAVQAAPEHRTLRSLLQAAEPQPGGPVEAVSTLPAKATKAGKTAGAALGLTPSPAAEAAAAGPAATGPEPTATAGPAATAEPGATEPATTGPAATGGAATEVPVRPAKTAKTAKPGKVGATVTGAGPSIAIAIQALTATNLTMLITPNTTATIFAPTDAAFISLASQLNLTSRQELLSNPVAASVAELHVVPGVAIRSTDLPEGVPVNATSLAGPTLEVTRTGSAVSVMVAGSNSSAQVVRANIPWNAAMVHIINRVLVPPANATMNATMALTLFPPQLQPSWPASSPPSPSPPGCWRCSQHATSLDAAPHRFGSARGLKQAAAADPAAGAGSPASASPSGPAPSAGAGGGPAAAASAEPGPATTANPAAAATPNGPNVATAIQAIEATGLTAALGPSTVATIFAPSDGAFASLAASLNASGSPTDLLASPMARMVAELHVVPGVTLRSTDLPDGQTVNATSLAGPMLDITRNGNAVRVSVAGTNSSAEVVQADIPWNAAVVHVINKVLVPPTNATAMP